MISQLKRLCLLVLAFALGACCLSASAASRYVRRYGIHKDTGEPMADNNSYREFIPLDRNYALEDELSSAQAATIAIWVRDVGTTHGKPTPIYGFGAPKILNDNGTVYTGWSEGNAGFGLYFDPATASYGVHFGAPSSGSDYVAVTTPAPADGNWHWLAATFRLTDGTRGELKLYLDGQLVGSAVTCSRLTFPGYVTDGRNMASLSLGGNACRDGMTTLTGYFTSAALWNRALDAATLAAFYAKKLDFSGSEGMTSYWPLDESSFANGITTGVAVDLTNPDYAPTSGDNNGNYQNCHTSCLVDDFPWASPALTTGSAKLTFANDAMDAAFSATVVDQDLAHAIGLNATYGVNVPSAVGDNDLGAMTHTGDGAYSLSASLADNVRYDDQVYARITSTLTDGDETCTRRYEFNARRAQVTYTWTGNGDGTTWNNAENWTCSSTKGTRRGYPCGLGAIAVFDGDKCPAAVDASITATEDIGATRTEFTRVGSLTLDLGGHRYFGGSSRTATDNNGNVGFAVSDAFPTVKNGTVEYYNLRGDSIANGVFPAPSSLTLKDVTADVWSAGSVERTQSTELIVDNTTLTVHGCWIRRGYVDEVTAGPVTIRNGGKVQAPYVGNNVVFNGVYFQLPDSTMSVGAGTELEAMSLLLGNSNVKLLPKVLTQGNIGFVAEDATLTFGATVYETGNNLVGEGVRIRYGTGNSIVLKNCTTKVLTGPVGIMEHAAVTNGAVRLDGGTLEAPNSSLAAYGRYDGEVVVNGAQASVNTLYSGYRNNGTTDAAMSREMRVVVSNRAEVAVANDVAISPGHGNCLTLDDATVTSGKAFRLFEAGSGGYCTAADEYDGQVALFTGARPRMVATTVVFGQKNGTTEKGEIRFAPPADGWTQPAISCGDKGTVYPACYSLSLIEPEGGFAANVTRIPLIQTGAENATFAAGEFASDVNVPEGVELHYDAANRLVYAYIPEHAASVSAFASATCSLVDSCKLVFSGALQRAVGETTVKVLWGDDAASLTHEIVLGTFPDGATDLAFSNADDPLELTFGRSVSYRIVSVSGGAVVDSFGGVISTSADNSTYTWTGLGETEDWSDVGNWTSDKPGKGAGYPAGASAKASFPAGTWRVWLDGLRTISSITVAEGADVTFASDDTTDKRLTSLYGPTIKGRLTLDAAGVYVNNSLGTLGTAAQLRATNGSYLRFADGNFAGADSFFEVSGNSYASVNTVRIGAGAKFIVDDAIIRQGGWNVLGYSKADSTLVIRGAKPDFFFNMPSATFTSDIDNAEASLQFEIPECGWEQAPIMSVANIPMKFFDTTRPGIVRLCALSTSAIANRPTPLTVPLVSWGAAGIKPEKFDLTGNVDELNRFSYFSYDDETDPKALFFNYIPETGMDISEPILKRNDDGSYAVSVAVTNDAAASVKLVYEFSDGSEPVEHVLASERVEAPCVLADPDVPAFPADTVVTVTAVAVADTEYGQTLKRTGVLFSGKVSVAWAADATDSAKGRFIVSRGTAEASKGLPLTVFLSYASTVREGGGYVALPESVVIPAGANEIAVEVTALKNVPVPGTYPLVVTVVDVGTYGVDADAGTATVPIKITSPAQLTFTWVGGESGRWQDRANWTCATAGYDDYPDGGYATVRFLPGEERSLTVTLDPGSMVKARMIDLYNGVPTVFDANGGHLWITNSANAGQHYLSLSNSTVTVRGGKMTAILRNHVYADSSSTVTVESGATLDELNSQIRLYNSDTINVQGVVTNFALATASGLDGQSRIFVDGGRLFETGNNSLYFCGDGATCEFANNAWYEASSWGVFWVQDNIKDRTCARFNDRLIVRDGSTFVIPTSVGYPSVMHYCTNCCITVSNATMLTRSDKTLGTTTSTKDCSLIFHNAVLRDDSANNRKQVFDLNGENPRLEFSGDDGDIVVGRIDMNSAMGGLVDVSGQASCTIDNFRFLNGSVDCTYRIHDLNAPLDTRMEFFDNATRPVVVLENTSVRLTGDTYYKKQAEVDFRGQAKLCKIAGSYNLEFRGDGTEGAILDFEIPSEGYREVPLQTTSRGITLQDGVRIRVTELPAVEKMVSMPLVNVANNFTISVDIEKLNANAELPPNCSLVLSGDKKTISLFHEDLAAQATLIDSVSAACTDYTNLTFSVTLKGAAKSDTTLLLAWGTEEGVYDRTNVIAQVAAGDPTLAYAYSFAQRMGTTVRGRVLVITQVGDVTVTDLGMTEVSTSPWEAKLTGWKMNYNWFDASVVMDFTLVPGSGVNVVDFEYGTEEGVYTTKLSATTFAGGPTTIRFPVPWLTNVKYWWHVTVTNTDPDGRGTAVAEQSGSATGPDNRRLAWNTKVAEGVWTDAANWYATHTTVEGYPATGSASFIGFAEDLPQPAVYTVYLTNDLTLTDIAFTNMNHVVLDLGGHELKLTSCMTLNDSNVDIVNGTLNVDRVFLRGEVPTTLTIKPGSTLILRSSNNPAASNVDATESGLPHRIVIEEGATFAPSDNRQYYNSSKLSLEMHPGSILGKGFYLGADGNGDFVGWTLDGVRIGGESGFTLNLRSDMELNVWNCTLTENAGASFAVDGAAKTNVFFHMSNTVWNSTGTLNPSGVGNTFLIEDCTFPGNGFNGISFPPHTNARDNTLYFKNSFGIVRDNFCAVQYNALAYNNTLVFDNSRLYRTNVAENTSQTLLASLDKSKDFSLVFKGANPVIHDSYIHVGTTSNFDADHMNTLRFEIPKAGWPEAPIQSGYDSTWNDGYFNVVVTLADGELDEDVAYVPLYESAKLTLNFKDSANPFSTWTIPDGTEVVYDKEAGTIGLRVTDRTDPCARLAKKSLPSHRFYGGLAGTVASLGPWGAATLKVRYGTVPYALDHVQTIGTYTADSASFDFAADTDVSFPITTRLFAQYELETVDPATGKTHVSRTGVIRRVLTQANTSLSWAGATVAGNTVVPSVTLNPPGGGTTTLKCLILDVNDPSFTNVVDFGTYPEDCITNVTTLTVKYAGLPVFLPKGTYKERFVAENSFNGKTYTTTCDSGNFNVTTAGFLWKQNLAKGDWEAANWTKLDADQVHDYPQTMADPAYFSSLVPSETTVKSDETVMSVEFLKSHPTKLVISDGKTLLATTTAGKTNGVVKIDESDVTIAGGSLVAQNLNLVSAEGTERATTLTLTNTYLCIGADGYNQSLSLANTLPGPTLNLLSDSVLWVGRNGGTGALESGKYATVNIDGGTFVVNGHFGWSNYGRSHPLFRMNGGALAFTSYVHFSHTANGPYVINDATLQVSGSTTFREGAVFAATNSAVSFAGEVAVVAGDVSFVDSIVNCGTSVSVPAADKTWTVASGNRKMGFYGTSLDASMSFVGSGTFGLAHPLFNGTNNVLRVADGATLNVNGWDFNAATADNAFEVDGGTVTNTATLNFATTAIPAVGLELVFAGANPRWCNAGESQLGSDDRLETSGRLRFRLSETAWTSAPLRMCTYTDFGKKQKKFIRKYIPITVERGAAPVGRGRNIPLVEWDDDPYNQITVTTETLNEIADLSTLPKGARLFVRGNVIYVRMPGELGFSVIVR